MMTPDQMKMASAFLYADAWSLRSARAPVAAYERSDLARLLREMADRSAAVAELVNEQAEDTGLWFDAATAPEAYLQHALRQLHATIEGPTPGSAPKEAKS